MRTSRRIHITAVGVAVVALAVGVQPLLDLVKSTFRHVLSLFALHLVVLYIYLRYVVSPTPKRVQHTRPLRMVHKSVWSRLEMQRQQDNGKVLSPLSSSSDISDAFDELLSNITSDFINSWFVHISGSSNEISFSNSVERIIRSIALALQERLKHTDLLAVLLNRVIPRITSHISDFRSAEMGLLGRSLERSITLSDELDLLLASQFRGGKLHPALTTAAMTTKPTEAAYLRQLMDLVLPHIMDTKDAACGPVRIILREVVVGVVLQPLMDNVADPDFWNQTIDTYLDKAIREQNMVKKFRDALDRHSTGITVDDIVEPVDTPSSSTAPTESTSRASLATMSAISQFAAAFLGLGMVDTWDPLGSSDFPNRSPSPGTAHLGRRSFQEFIKMIEEETNLLDLRRVRNDIITQIRKKKVQIANRDRDEVVDGDRVEDIRVYVNRLTAAKKKVDKRIGILSGEQPREKKLIPMPLFGKRRKSLASDPPVSRNLRSILTHPAGLPYFMEFMDRRGKMLVVQFWLNVEGFRQSYPLPKDINVSDIRTLYDTYCSKHAIHHLPISDQLQTRMERLMESGNTSGMMECLYDIQQVIYEHMVSEHFSYFKRSDLYFKYLQSCAQMPTDTEPERRSLDEPTLHRWRDDAQDGWVAASKSASLERPRSVHEIEDPGLLSDSADDTKNTDMSASDPALGDTTRNRPRHSVSESAWRGSPRFLSLGKVFESANDWWRTNNVAKPLNVADDTLTAEVTLETSPPDQDLSDEVLSQPDHPTLDVDPPGRKIPVRRNTVDAVEAALQTIMTSESQPVEQVVMDSDEVATPRTPTRLGAAALMRGSRVKADKADPVQMSVIPTWTKSTDTIPQTTTAQDQLALLGATPGTHKAVAVPLPHPTRSHSSDQEPANVHLAPPGDLMLTAAIERLSEEIDKLTQQEAIVDALIDKAETKDKLEELRILRKSKSMFQQDLQQLQYQKHQYELQASENVLTPGRTKLNITSSTIGSDQHGDFACYIIEIRQLGLDGNVASGWLVARRYSEFFSLHQKLKELYPLVRHLEFPSKWPILNLQSSFVETRRVSLERYLRHLVEIKAICQSEALRTFLSQQNIYVPTLSRPERDTSESNGYGFFTSFPRLHTRSSSTRSSESDSKTAPSRSSSAHMLRSSSAGGLSSTPAMSEGDAERQPRGFMKHIYRTVAAGIDDILIGPSMLDLITQRLSEQVMESTQDNPADRRSPRETIAPEMSISRSMDQLASPDLKPTEPDALAHFTEPLCDLFIEMFELKEKNNWLRRQAVVIILQQILGGTIERKLRESIRFLSAETMVVFYMRKLLNTFWPNGSSFAQRIARTPEQRSTSREEANRKLSTWLPEMLGGMVGRFNARRGARRLFTVLQNKRLNQDLAYILLDEIVLILFPELSLSDLPAH